ncbi:hypothetical protein Tsubulata_040531 [Turnera subulata]|uniref:Uncharacterized protein n=1 Tax=Turnera subulata TaxID=218843 RepID=A0A9Q0JCC7_9ROSI|nr:hypothetical protein Tsubulata_040531 [Turnera subulata]
MDSAVFEMGNTKVQNKGQQIGKQALVRCEYSMANFSTGDRMRKPKGDRLISMYKFSKQMEEPDSAGGPDVTVGFLPALDRVTLLQVLEENTKQLEYRRGL